MDTFKHKQHTSGGASPMQPGFRRVLADYAHAFAPLEPQTRADTVGAIRQIQHAAFAGRAEVVERLLQRGGVVGQAITNCAIATFQVGPTCERANEFLFAGCCGDRLRATRHAALLAQLAQGATMYLLARGRQDAPARQHSLRATIAWSYTLLDAHSQCCLRLLAVFAGGATIAAITAVLDGPNAPADAAFCSIDTLATLIDNSLVQALPSDPPRFVLLDTIRHFASEQLRAAGEVAAANARHAAYFVHLAEQSEHHRFGAGHEAWLHDVARDLDNLRAALAWLLEQNAAADAARFAVAMGHFWLARGMVREGRQWAERTWVLAEATLPMGTDQHSELVAALLQTLARLARYQNDYAAAHWYAERSLALYQQREHSAGMARALETCGTIALDHMKPAASRRTFARAERRVSRWRSLERRLHCSHCTFVLQCA